MSYACARTLNMSWIEYENFYFKDSTEQAGWQNARFDQIRELIDEEEQFIKNPIKLEDGVMPCRKCESLKTYSYQKQVKSSDEGFTTFVSCFSCGARWSET